MSLIRSFINTSSVTSLLCWRQTPLSFSVFDLVDALPLFRSFSYRAISFEIRQNILTFYSCSELFGTFVIFSWSRSTISQADWTSPQLFWLHLLYFDLLFPFGSTTFWCHSSVSLCFHAGLYYVLTCFTLALFKNLSSCLLNNCWNSIGTLTQLTQMYPR